ncbi:MAG TPA: hypothetical protein VIK89_00485 [Cytophagaceae bacterium]
MKKNWFLVCFRWLIFFIIAVVVLSFVVMKLWNWILPDLFAIAPLTYPKALGLLVLTRILFGNFKSGQGHCSQCTHNKYNKGGNWKRKFKDKLKSMTPEERERFKENYYNKCGGAWDKDEC